MMPGDERDEIGAPDDGRGQAKPPIHEPACEAPTMATDNGGWMDWSVPRFCNLSRGHGGGHVWVRSQRAEP